MISEIETAILLKIRNAHETGVLGYTVKKIDTYGGEFSEGLDKFVRAFPAILLIFSGLTRVSNTNGRVKFTARWSVIVAAKNLRNQAQARHGSDDRVGSYQMISDMLALLSNQTFGLQIDPLIPQSVTPLLNDLSGSQLSSVYGIEFQTAFETETPDTEETLADFETFHANWDIPVHGNVSENLPADATADATDHVTLETTP